MIAKPATATITNTNTTMTRWSLQRCQLFGTPVRIGSRSSIACSNIHRLKMLRWMRKPLLVDVDCNSYIQQKKWSVKILVRKGSNNWNLSFWIHLACACALWIRKSKIVLGESTLSNFCKWQDFQNEPNNKICGLTIIAATSEVLRSTSYQQNKTLFAGTD